MIRFLLFLFISLPVSAEPVRHLNQLLDGFHHAAATANYEAYFDYFSDDGIFMGTDASERWTVEEFKQYARAPFEAGRGWTYLPVERHWNINSGVAWFDEQLDNEKLGRCRGTGVLVQQANGEWKLAHYSLTLLVPNEIAVDVGAQSRKLLPPSTSQSSAPSKQQ